jgi:D-alanyl-D-alanine dipeptidase
MRGEATRAFVFLALAGCGGGDLPESAPTVAPPPAKTPAPPPPPPPYTAAHFLRPPPEGWVDLRAHIPGLRTDIRYHTADNFTEAPLPGYGAPGAWLLEAPADALRAVQADLAEANLGLLIYDAYRPRRGTLGMVAWAERTEQVHLLDNGYIARVSGHNRGNTIDLTLVDLTTGKPLDMGTPWDTLSEDSHTKNADGEALANRMRLKSAMRAHGWTNYWKEWWHYSFDLDPRPALRDVPYACFEPDEGFWAEPSGWNAPGYAMPTTVTFEPCEGMDPTRVPTTTSLVIVP